MKKNFNISRKNLCMTRRRTQTTKYDNVFSSSPRYVGCRGVSLGSPIGNQSSIPPDRNWKSQLITKRKRTKNWEKILHKTELYRKTDNRGGPIASTLPSSHHPTQGGPSSTGHGEVITIQCKITPSDWTPGFARFKAELIQYFLFFHYSKTITLERGDAALVFHPSLG